MSLWLDTKSDLGCREVEVLFRLTSGGMPTSSPNSALNPNATTSLGAAKVQAAIACGSRKVPRYTKVNPVVCVSLLGNPMHLVQLV